MRTGSNSLHHQEQTAQPTPSSSPSDEAQLESLLRDLFSEVTPHLATYSDTTLQIVAERLFRTANPPGSLRRCIARIDRELQKRWSHIRSSIPSPSSEFKANAVRLHLTTDDTHPPLRCRRVSRGQLHQIRRGPTLARMTAATPAEPGIPASERDLQQNPLRRPTAAPPYLPRWPQRRRDRPSRARSTGALSRRAWGALPLVLPLFPATSRPPGLWERWTSPLFPLSAEGGARSPGGETQALWADAGNAGVGPGGWGVSASARP